MLGKVDVGRVGGLNLLARTTCLDGGPEPDLPVWTEAVENAYVTALEDWAEAALGLHLPLVSRTLALAGHRRRVAVDGGRVNRADDGSAVPRFRGSVSTDRSIEGPGVCPESCRYGIRAHRWSRASAAPPAAGTLRNDAATRRLSASFVHHLRPSCCECPLGPLTDAADGCEPRPDAPSPLESARDFVPRGVVTCLENR